MSEPSPAPHERPESEPASPLHPVPDRKSDSFLERAKALRDRYHKLEMVSFFGGGFVFDAYMLRRIDDTPMLLQQGAYLLVAGALIVLGHLIESREVELQGALKKLWRTADPLVHFMLGTLLNAFMIFYMKAASGLTAALFFVVIAASLAINELPFFHRYGRLVLLGLYSFCATSYFAYLLPVLIGRMRSWMFYLAVALALAVLLGLGKLFARSQPAGGWRQVLIPGLSVQLLLAGLYVLRLIPPVPLSVEQLGIYHDVAHVPGGGYTLAHEPAPWWKFWVKDDRTFLARTGDKVYCFVRIFAPRNFHDQVSVHWAYEDPVRGWLDQGAFPLPIVGGREEGFRGYATKARYKPGRWRVSVQTEDGRTIDDLGFTITASDATEPRELVRDPA